MDAFGLVSVVASLRDIFPLILDTATPETVLGFVCFLPLRSHRVSWKLLLVTARHPSSERLPGLRGGGRAAARGPQRKLVGEGIDGAEC